ncbi:MAG: histidinol-phosphate transaminase [Patescibacteria group bacterium]
MPKINFTKLAKKSVRSSAAYSSARSLVREASIFLDANENAFGSVLPKISNVELSRYPDPLAKKLREQFGKFVGVSADQVLVGNGSDEIIWLLLLAFVEAGQEILTFAPTFSMYRVFAELLGLRVREVALEADYSLDTAKLLRQISAKTKLIFLCSPNNPTGQVLPRAQLEQIIRTGKLVVLDEAYIEFAPEKSAVALLRKFPNLIILRTFSKAWGLAGLRVGCGLMDAAAIAILQKVRAPYSVDALSQKLALDALANSKKMQAMVKKILAEKEKLAAKLWELGLIVFPSDANFLLVRFPAEVSASRVQKNLLEKFGIVVRDFSHKKFLENCVRITVGNPNENEELLRALRSFKDLSSK